MSVEIRSGGSRRRLENEIRELSCETVEGIELIQTTVQWWILWGRWWTLGFI